MQSDTLEERYAIKFCFKLGENATKTYGMLQAAFRASCMNRASVIEWHKRFKEGMEAVRDSCTKKVWNLIEGITYLTMVVSVSVYSYLFYSSFSLNISLSLPLLCFDLLTRPKCHSRWCTGRKWHILMAVMRGNRVGGNWLMKWDEQEKFPWYTTEWCTGREWPLNCMTVISAWWRLNIRFQRSSGCRTII